MNAIGIALVWCVVQVTLIGLLAAGLYLLVRRLRPAAAASVVLTGLAMVVVLSLLVLSPWPRWTIHQLHARPLGERAGDEGHRARHAGRPFVTGKLRSEHGDAARPLRVRAGGDEPVRIKTSHRAPHCFGRRSWMNLPSRRRPPDKRLALAGGGGRAAACRDGLRAWVAHARRRGRAMAAAAQPAGARSSSCWSWSTCFARNSVAAGRSRFASRTIWPRRPRSAGVGRCCLLPADWTSLDGRPASGRLGPRDCPRPQPRFSGPAGRATWTGAALLPSAAALADGSFAVGAGIGGRRRGGERFRRAAAISDDDRRTCLAAAGPAAVVARPHVFPYSNHISQENCHAQGLQASFRSALAGGATDDGRRRVVVRPVGGRPSRACWPAASIGRGSAKAPREKPAASATRRDKRERRPLRTRLLRESGGRASGLGPPGKNSSKPWAKPDDDSSSDWLKWKNKHHIECTFHGGDKAAEVRFNPGFKGALTNGLKLGSPGGEVLKLYGEPEHVVDRGNGAKEYEYSKRAFYSGHTRGKITQIVVFKPYQFSQNKSTGDPPKIVSTSPADGAKDVDRQPQKSL